MVPDCNHVDRPVLLVPAEEAINPETKAAANQTLDGRTTTEEVLN